MTLKIVVQAPGQSRPEELQLDEGRALVVGRAPDVTRAKDAPSSAVDTAAIDSASVSATHVVITHRGAVTTVRDAASRNGTWLRLPPGDPVDVRSSRPLSLYLAMPTADAAVPDAPPDAAWTGTKDFESAVMLAIANWLSQQGMPAQLAVVPRTPEPAPGRIPLTASFDLSVMPEQTMDAQWDDEVLPSLWRYVARQKALFEAEEEARAEGLILASPSIRRAYQQVVEAAHRGIRVLLIGPSGAGKDGLARAYHRHSGRSGAFIAKNCGSMTKELLRAELFGTEVGAFTGAVRMTGAVERAHGGTLFLDEIGEIALDLQPMLLTFLDHGEYERIGGKGVRNADVRVVALTNKDLRAAALEGTFRHDLWYRLAGHVVELPPLSERYPDVEAYLQLRRLKSGTPVLESLTEDAIGALRAHPWPGNFRELGGFVDQLPHDARARSIDARACREALARVTLLPARRLRAPSDAGLAMEIDRVAAGAAEAFREDVGHAVGDWDDVKEFIEKYLKPLLFAHLSGGARITDPRDADIPSLAAAVAADRGTAQKQLNRYFDRFLKGV